MTKHTHPKRHLQRQPVFSADTPKAALLSIIEANPGKSSAAIRRQFFDFLETPQGAVFLPTIIKESLQMAAIDEDAPEELRELAQLMYGPEGQ